MKSREENGRNRGGAVSGDGEGTEEEEEMDRQPQPLDVGSRGRAYMHACLVPRGVERREPIARRPRAHPGELGQARR